MRAGPCVAFGPVRNLADRHSKLMTQTHGTCPHCGSRLKKWLVPEGATWSEDFFLVCFNDDCSYYKDGWEWMKQQYSQNASYRFALNPTNGSTLQIPVWSDTATRQMIVDNDEGCDP